MPADKQLTVLCWETKGEKATDNDDAIALRRVVGKLARQLNNSSTDAGLTPSQASVLGLIVAQGPLSLLELGQEEGLNRTMLSRIISKLQGLGFIDRDPDPADLRSASVTATSAGLAVDEQIKGRRAAAVMKGILTLGPEHVDALSSALPALELLAEAMSPPSTVSGS